MSSDHRAVRDDGVGFDRDRVGLDTATSDSFGLRAMAERVEQLGGGLTVDSAPGRGTTVTITDWVSGLPAPRTGAP